MIEWISSLDSKIHAALIGASVSLIVILLRDYVFLRLSEKRNVSREEMAVFRNYADPISSAASSLFWRLRETLTMDGHGAYLKHNGSETPFDLYKYKSTLYRISALIAWLRAYRRELTYFSVSNSKKLRALNSAIESFEKSLSDGDHVEELRVKSICSVWKIDPPKAKDKMQGAKIQVERVLKKALANGKAELAVDLQPTQQRALCNSIAEIVHQIRGTYIPDSKIEESVPLIMRSLSIREAWLYREYQTGIGDLLIHETNTGARRFEVVGFFEFESLLLSDDEKNKRWISRVEKIVDGLDLYETDHFDARIQLLQSTFLAVIGLIVSLSEVEAKRETISKATLRTAKGLRKDYPWRSANT